MYFVIDIGGTNTKIAIFNKKALKKKIIFSTPSNFETGLKLIYKKIELLTKDSIDSIAIGIPGNFDKKIGMTLKTPNLPLWNNKKITEIFSKKYNVKVLLANDAELGALGEALYGAGKDFRSVAFITISTGIGGALVVDKKLVPRIYNSEPGHTTIDLSSKIKDSLGITGSLEALVSGRNFEKIYGVKPATCENSKVWENYAEFLSTGIVNVILMWSPEVLVIGGGISQKRDLLFSPLKKLVKKKLINFPAPSIIPAQLGDSSGLFGGLALIEQNTSDK